jgi:N-acetylmuramoyl-L-alanine amidase
VITMTKPNYTYRIDHIPRGTAYNRRPALPMTATTITIHNTGNPTSTAAGERGWLTDNPKNDRTASYHIVLDAKEAIEVLPLNEVAWHAGDGSKATSGNRTSIGIEICERDVTLGEYAQALENAIDLAAKMLHERGWGVDRLRRHYDWSQKNCPRLMNIDNRWTGWQQFKDRVKSKLEELSSKKIEEGDEEMKLADGQWKMLETNINTALTKGIISDKTWLEKVKQRTITNSELNWLNNVIAMRLLK